MVLVEDYKKAILTEFTRIRYEQYAEFLVHPTPARLKKMCIFIADALTANDKEIYKRFFMCKEEDGLYKKMENFDTDKFKPLSNFLKGKSELTSLSSFDLLAVLVGVGARPYQKFRQAGSMDYIPFCEDGNEAKTKNNDAIVLGVVILLAGATGLVLLKNTVFKEESRMVWKDDHYEIAFSGTKNDVASIPLDKEMLAHQRKIAVNYTTVFFLPNGKPCVWYCKTGTVVEFFSYSGMHPVTGKTLKEVTHYIIYKYVYARR